MRPFAVLATECEGVDKSEDFLMVDVYREECEEVLTVGDGDLPMSFTEDRHLEAIEGINCVTQTWRMKERVKMKTVSVALVLCLNVGVDPPDVVKTQPCARLECWIDPLSMSAAKALEKIGLNLQTQYERWQPRARYKQTLDPTSEDVKKLCTSLRRNAKEERVLFHYNGHGVPKPTTNGEIWVFNRTYTQYIPLSIYDLQSWMGAPSIYVYDCSNAGIIVSAFKHFAAQHQAEFEQAAMSNSRNGTPPLCPNFQHCIQLAACDANQVLPMNPDLPADLFTSCLTTPINVALKWFVLQSTSKLVPKVTMDLIDKIPGQITDRRTMLGELNWIFTAITDTIAWNTLPRELFQKLFRQDLLVASLFRNFLLAERIMKSCDCTPVSHPALPPTFQHSMWNAWDLALDLSLGQLPGIIYRDEPFKHLPFFEEQLTAFQVWLELGSEERNPPEQLPIVLQVLLSQVHRMRALELLGKFLDLGPWAVNLALSVGIFPYVLKLLQSCAKELRPLLVFIWAKILAVDNTCQADLVRDNGHKYFLMVLQDTTLSAEHRTQATFVLACIVSNFRDGQEAALQGSLVSVCLEQLNDPCKQLRQWVAICLGRLWDHYDKARWTGVRDTAHEKLYILLKDPCPEVRAAAVYALGTFINSVKERSEHANNIDNSVVMTLLNVVSSDMSSLVRKELVCALQWVVLAFEQIFVNICLKEGSILSSSGGMRRSLRSEDNVDRIKRVSSSSSINNLTTTKSYGKNLGTLPSISYGSVYTKIWQALCSLETDPHPEVASMCCTITGNIRALVTLVKEPIEILTDSSISLPPSPNRSNYLSGNYSPVNHRHHHSYFNSSNTISEDKTLKKSTKDKVALVQTNFFAWASKSFAQSKKKDTRTSDFESKVFYERDWRITRNNNIRAEAVEEQRSVGITGKTDVQVFHTKPAVPPALLQMHPFDQQLAVAGKDSFAIWDWGTGAKTMSCQNKSLKFPNSSKVTALEWINGHDIAMLMVGADDGSVKLWRPKLGHSREPTLISAWEAFSSLNKQAMSVLLSWEQWTETLLTAGEARVIRLWDINREYKAFDIPTGTDSAVTCIDSTFSSICHERHSRYQGTEATNQDDPSGRPSGASLGLVTVGCADGSVRVFDRRANPSDARVKVWMDHKGPVLGVQMRDNLVISGSSKGDVRMYDVRMKNSFYCPQESLDSGMSCISIHRTANYYACGSTQQYISIHNLKGYVVNTIKFYEGFMGQRIGPLTCLNYHPHKITLAAGTSDCSLMVYSLEGRR